MSKITKLVAISAMLMASFLFANGSPPKASQRSRFVPDICWSLPSPGHCQENYNCEWDSWQNRCKSRQNNWGQCQFVYDFRSCVNTPGCSWDRGRCFAGGNGGGPDLFPGCRHKTVFECSQSARCHWNPWNSACEDGPGRSWGNGGYPPNCAYIYDFQRCDYTSHCFWNSRVNACQSKYR